MFLVNPSEFNEITLPMVLAQAPADADPQVLTAWTLACSFSHGWAAAGGFHPNAPECAYLGCHHGRNIHQTVVPATWEEVNVGWAALEADSERRMEEDRRKGRSYNNFNEAGLSPATSHETASKRIRWEVATDGTVTVEIHRPTGAVCGLRPDGKVWRAKPNSPTGAPQARHLRALSWVLRDLGHPEARHYAELADSLDGEKPPLSGYAPPVPLPPLDEAAVAEHAAILKRGGFNRSGGGGGDDWG